MPTSSWKPRRSACSSGNPQSRATCLSRAGALLDAAPGLLHALPVDVRPRARAETRAELPRKVARAHAHAPRKAFDRQVGARVVEHPQFQFAEEVVAFLRLQVPAELRLAAGPLEEQHEFLRHGERDGLAVVLLDQREREVHAGRDARGGVDVPGLHVERIAIDAGARRQRRQPVEVAPVRRRGPAVEETGRREQHRAVADGAEARDALRLHGQPVEHRAVLHGRLPADAAGDQQRVRVTDVGVAARRNELEAVRHRDRAGARGDEFRAVGGGAPAAMFGEPARGAREHLERPGDVQHLGLRETQHDDAVRPWAGSRAAILGHESHVSAARAVRRGTVGRN